MVSYKLILAIVVVFIVILNCVISFSIDEIYGLKIVLPALVTTAGLAFTILFFRPKEENSFSNNGSNQNELIFEFLYVIAGQGLANSNLLFFEDYKDLNLPPCRLTAERETVSPDAMKLNIRTDYFAKFVKIEPGVEGVGISDNYFDLMPGEEKLVTITRLPANSVGLDDLVVTALNQNR